MLRRPCAEPQRPRVPTPPPSTILSSSGNRITAEVLPLAGETSSRTPSFWSRTRSLRAVRGES